MSEGMVTRLGKTALKAPIYLYRWTLKPLIGMECRHLPTCSEYSLEAIEKNGAWRGFWLTLSRVLRCHPWGSAGYDPPPDIRGERHPLAPWRYGRWTGRHIRPVSDQAGGATRASPAPPKKCGPNCC